MSPIIERMKVAFLQENKRSPDTRRGLSSEETRSDRMRVTVEQVKDAIPPAPSNSAWFRSPAMRTDFGAQCGMIVAVSNRQT